jgi:acyl-CoA synthetase (AMP-forming)/AMP-acid ligase II
VVQADYWFDGPGSIVCNLPIDHVGALGNICATALVTGSTIVFQERFDAAGVLGLIERERVTYWGAAPTMFLLSVNTPEWRTADLSSLHKIIWSGGAAPIALIRALASRCSNLVTSYGMTETVGEVTFSDPADDLDTLSVTIGRPEPRYEVQIVRDDGSQCDEDEEGEIVVRGDFIMRGYMNEAEATAATIDPNGWLHTGDVARRRSDGCYVLVGRKTDMYKSGGYNVYPREVELALEEHPAVHQAGVVAVKDDTWGSVGHAFVLADPSEVRAEDLDTFVRERLANYKVPKRFTITPDLPMLPIGKLDKKALKASANE